ncbi:MAG: thioesterase family protein [Actinobacteria bacterium]|nr:thioesterase family protein [Actinomycetota bacterium]
MTAFGDDTAITKIGPGRYEAKISENWWVVRGPHGGYLASILLRALIDTVDDSERAPRSLTVHYATAPQPGPAHIETDVVRSGTSLSTVSARLVQDDRPVAVALAAFSKPWKGLDYTDTTMPESVPPEQGFPIHETDGIPPFVKQFHMMGTLGEIPFSGADHAKVGGWFRLAEAAVVDPVAVPTLMDAWPPVVFPVATELLIAPTVDLTIHFRAPLPHAGAEPDDYYLGVFWSHLARDGFFEEDGELWSKDGVLLAQSRQLALTLMPRK